MSELKLRRLLEHNQRLREDLGRPRIRVSEASASLIRYCKTTTDHLVSPLSLSTPAAFHFSFSNLAPSTITFGLLVGVACCGLIPLRICTDAVFLYTGSICMGSYWQK